jgi:hypothetical protein
VRGSAKLIVSHLLMGMLASGLFSSDAEEGGCCTDRRKRERVVNR